MSLHYTVLIEDMRIKTKIKNKELRKRIAIKTIKCVRCITAKKAKQTL